MNSPRVKALVVVCVLFLLVSFVTVGCSKKKDAWVNTKSMPGHALAGPSQDDNQGNDRIVYLGADETPQETPYFGPRDVSFEFENLK